MRKRKAAVPAPKQPPTDAAPNIPTDNMDVLPKTQRQAQQQKVDFDIHAELGLSGLKRSAGFVLDEFLDELRGSKGIKVFREMRDNSAVVGASLRAIEMAMRQVDWKVKPGTKDAIGDETAEFVESCFNDMSNSWEDTLSEISTMLTFGHSFHEVVYKVRGGESEDATQRSRYQDGRIGWRKISLRAQETLHRWEFDDEGGIRGMYQIAAPDYRMRFIPIEKALLFRTTVEKNNPEGRALDPETPIPTPDGWRAMGQIQPGDKVFDEQGRIRYVVDRAEWQNRPCYRLTFSDGSEIIADAEHLWPTQTQRERSKRRPGRPRTTREIAGSLKQRMSTTAEVTNHSIAWAEPLDFPEASLPLPPYFLGLWLGDGTSRSADVSCHADDAEETCAALAECGIEATVSVNGGSENGRFLSVRGSQRWSADAPRRALRALGVIENKRVPAAYMRSSIQQRHDLLAGLMDSDGHVDHFGRCEFSNRNAGLSACVAELVRSLGVAAYETTKTNSAGNPQWLVKFTPSFVPFRLTRKRARCKTVRARMQHYIVAAEEVEPRDTVCIEVDSPSHLFLAGTALVPTHNSVLRTAYFSWYFAKRLQEIEAIGIERDLNGLPIAYVPFNLMTPSATEAQKGVLNTIKTILRDVRRDEQEGIVFPLLYDDRGNKEYSIELLSSPSRRESKTNDVVSRYNLQIATSLMTDFLSLGHDAVGSRALADPKIDFFLMSLNALLDAIAEVFNRYGIPRLLKLNGITVEDPPLLTHSEARSPKLEEVGTYVANLAKAGMPIFPHEELQKHLLGLANLPNDEVAIDTAAGEPEAIPGEDEPLPDDPLNPAQGQETGLGYLEDEEDDAAVDDDDEDEEDDDEPIPPKPPGPNGGQRRAAKGNPQGGDLHVDRPLGRRGRFRSRYKTPPWHLEPSNGKWLVVGTENGKVYGKHPDRARALAHMRALYANVNE